MDIDFDKLEFTPVFREEILKETKRTCKEEHIEFMKLFKVFGELDKFLASKCMGQDCPPKQYFTRLLNIRVKDHFSSAIILASQGFTVDAISLTRSAMEDLFIILNFYLDSKYFQKWYENKDDFEIKPGKLRNNNKIHKDDREFYNKVYKALCNIVHARKNSIEHMIRFHPTVLNKGVEGIDRIKKDIKLINLSFYTYINQVSKLLKTIHKDVEDITFLDSIINDLFQITSVYDFLKESFDNN